jgi:hypothetical protein
MLTTNERDRLMAQWEQWDRESEAYTQAMRSGFGTSVRAIHRLFGRDAGAGTAGSPEDPRPGTAAT